MSRMLTLNRLGRFRTVFIQASYSFLGTEMVAITAGEAANPRKTVPKAVTRVFYRYVSLDLARNAFPSHIVARSFVDGLIDDRQKQPLFANQVSLFFT